MDIFELQAEKNLRKDAPLAERLKPEKLVTHRFNFKDVIKAYDTFANASKEQALKVMISMV